MWLWAWFTGGGWILVAGGAVVLGLVAAAMVVGATARKRYAGRHVSWCWWHGHGRCNCEFVEEPPEQDFYGSMTLAGEMQARGWLAAPEVAHSGWYGQTAADLSPEALAGSRPEWPPERRIGLAPETVSNAGPASPGLGCSDRPGPDAGPGDAPSLSSPGPDPDWLDRQLALHVAWVARMAPMVTGWSVAA